MSAEALGVGDHVACDVVLVCWGLSGQVASPGGGGYLPLFPDWSARSEAGTATAKEWRDNRFRFFLAIHLSAPNRLSMITLYA